MHAFLKSALATVVSLPLAVAVATPAEAGSRWSYRSTDLTASASWMEMGTLPGGVAGNVHVGFLEVSKSGWAYGQVIDWTCPEGELPPSHGGGHGELAADDWEEPETNCVAESFREIYGDGLDVRISKKLDAATVTGTLQVSDHETGTGGAPAVSMTFTGFGDVASSSWIEKGSEGTSSWVYKYESRTRQATVDGAIGAMGFTDDADDVSSASLAETKTYERGSTR